jgi:protein tyrosine phosphatase (PTP) superfamily phosphohydrolase (DUF442 family)
VALRAIRNFVALTNELATAGQPTEDQLVAVRDSGYTVVVNLGLADPRYCLPDEQRSVLDLGMSYRHIPVNFESPTASDFQAFCAVMSEARGQRVFVHCAANFRVSCFVALWGEFELGWSRQKADAHIEKLWEPNAVWAEFLAEIRAESAPAA